MDYLTWIVENSIGEARRQLIAAGVIAYDAPLYQVLGLEVAS